VEGGDAWCGGVMLTRSDRVDAAALLVHDVMWHSCIAHAGRQKRTMLQTTALHMTCLHTAALTYCLLFCAAVLAGRCALTQKAM
jgi:hypothetical protein